MIQEFVNYDIALKLKDIGFDEDCLAGYQPTRSGDIKLFFKSTKQSGISTNPPCYGKYCHQNKHIVKAPLYQQVFGWFRGKGYNANIIVENREYGYHCGQNDTDAIGGSIGFETYEIAQTECILELINQITE